MSPPRRVLRHVSPVGLALVVALVSQLPVSSLACSSSSHGSAASGPTGTMVLFDATADFTQPANFYDFPWPSDLRLTSTGTPDLTGMANPTLSQVFAGLIQIAQENTGYPVLPVAWFDFTADLAALSPTDVIPAAATSPILLVDVDPTSSTLGKLFPTIAETIPQDNYVPDGLLAVGPRPGIVLEPKHQYAYVVMTSAQDVNGADLAVAPALAQALAGGSSSTDPVAQLYSVVPPALQAAGVDPTQVAAATVFTTGDVVADLSNLSTMVFQKYASTVSITDLAVDPMTLDTNERFCELQGQVTYPQFQVGSPPYDTGGLFTYDSTGMPIVQGQQVSPITITLPKSAMPSGGYPLIVYFHGTGGISHEIADRGPWRVETDTTNCPPGQADAYQILETWNGTTGCYTPGQGPGWVMAPLGFAMAGSAMPVNPQRWPAGLNSDLPEYLNINNVAATRDIFRQGVLEERMFFDALSRLTIDPSLVATCSGLSLPAGETAYHFAASPLLAQGQSMGAMYANMISAVEPRIQAVVPTGSGGYWSYFILQTQFFPNIEGDLGLLLGLRGTFSHLHPAMHVVQMALEPVDPIVYMPRLGYEPLPTHPVRPVYEPHGMGDSYFPTDVQDAVAMAYRHKETGVAQWPTMQTALQLEGLDGILPYDVTNDVTSVTGTPRTGVVVQYMGDGVYDPHCIFQQLDSVKYQYGCFFQTFLQTGKATVPAPADFSVPCPTQ
ncbi:MAG: hypothetical protein ABSE49_05340 [Polyangiaceae bacterium]